jgi:hypothetical protein
MSYTTIYRVPTSGGIESVGEFRNSHGSAGYIWTEMVRAHHGEEKAFTWICDKALLRSVWALVDDASQPDFVRIAMATTFDGVMVRRENLQRVANAFREFVAAHPPGDYACSLLDQAVLLNTLARDDECFAVCWNQTSVSDGWPDIYPTCPHCGGEMEDEARAYDVSVDSEHWFLFDKLERPDEEYPEVAG